MSPYVVTVKRGGDIVSRRAVATSGRGEANCSTGP